MDNKHLKPQAALQDEDHRHSADGNIWPSSNYNEQIERLKAAIGQRVFLVELKQTDINMAIHHTDKAYELLAVIDYPRPDPEKGLFPHNILLDDGRGVNLGRIARITIDSAFSPEPGSILFEETTQFNKLTSSQHRGTPASIAATSKELLGAILGDAGQSASRIEDNTGTDNSDDQS